MKLQFLLFGLLIILFSACKKQIYNATSQAAIDEVKIQKYIAANHITATKDPSGIYYQILTPNPGPHPSIADSDTVQVTYTGKLLNGGVFDSANVTTLALTDLIPGFADGMQLIGTNGTKPYGRILIIIPSSLGYGSVAQPAGNGVAIPPNNVLVYTVDLIGFYGK